MLWEENPLSSQFPLFPVVLSPPEEGMEPEDPKDRNEKCGHNDEDPIEHWLSLWIIMGRMGKPHYEVSIGMGMAFPAGLYQPCIGDERFGIIPWEDTMKTMAIGTTRYQSWVAQMLDLSMITFVIGLSGDEKNLVSLHHLFICMTFLANLSMELLPKCHSLGFISF
jgi:hypothetical protein